MSSELSYLVPMAERPLRERVALNVRIEMTRNGVKQIQLAAVLGLTQQAVSMKVNGLRPFSLDDLEVIAPLFGMSAAELVQGEAGRPRPGDPDGGVTVRHQGLEPRTR